MKQSSEGEKTLYRVGYESQARGLNGFAEALTRCDFLKRRERLVAGLDEESVTTVDRILKRLRQIVGCPQGQELDLYTKEEQQEFENAKKELDDAIISIRSDLFYWNGCFLPIRHFEPSVFLYRYGLEHLKTLGAIGDRAIIDAGAFVGDSAWIFSPYTKGKVYSFEPLSENFECLEKSIEYNGLDNVIPIKAALGKKLGKLKLAVGGFTAGASLCNRLVGGERQSEQVDVFKLDDFVEGRKIRVGLIKSDVEGAEQLLLRGAEGVIRRDRPILVISIYHNANDFFEIKSMIEAMDLGYKFKIYHPPIKNISGETLLFAEVPDRSCQPIVQPQMTARELAIHETMKLLREERNAARERLQVRWGELESARASQKKAWDKVAAVESELKAARERLQMRWGELESARVSQKKAWDKVAAVSAELKKEHVSQKRAWAQHAAVVAKLKAAHERLQIRWKECEALRGRLRVLQMRSARMQEANALLRNQRWYVVGRKFFRNIRVLFGVRRGDRK